MNRPFTAADNGKRFEYSGHAGTLEYPLIDPGPADSDEAIIWYDTPRRTLTREYVKPIDVEPA